MNIRPDTHADFEALAAGARACAEETAATFEHHLLIDGVWKNDDQFDTLTEAANAYVESYADWGEGQKVIEVWADGSTFDLTSEARAEVETWNAQRGDTAPWDSAECDTCNSTMCQCDAPFEQWRDEGGYAA